MEAVILGGGAGKGLKAVTGGKPKVLLSLCGEPLIQRVIKNLASLGVKKATIITDRPQDFEDITTRLGKLMEFEVRKQRKPEVVGAILEAADVLSKGAMLVYGDTLVPPDAYLLTISVGVESGKPTLMIVPDEDTELYGAITVDERGNVTEFKEKPKKPEEGAYAFGGVSVLNKELVELLESYGDLEKAINEYITSGGVIKTVLWSGRWVDLGYPINALEAIYYILTDLDGSYISRKAHVANTAVIEGPVIIEDDAVIDHYAVIKGPAYIGKGVLIGTHSFIRPYTDIEAETTVSSFSEIVWSLVEEKSTIGRGTFLGYSVVGYRAIIEPGVTTKLLAKPEVEGIKAIKIVKRRRKYFKAGAVIGAGSRVPAMHVLEPGTEIQ